MGARGPAKTPSALNALRGNPGKRAVNAREPRPAVGVRIPGAPRWLSQEARRFWRPAARALHACGLLTDVDVVALGMLCESLAQYLAAREIVEDSGMIGQTERGYVYVHPAMGLMKAARADVLKFAREFGMTPSARTRINVEGGDEEPSLAELLFRSVGE